MSVSVRMFAVVVLLLGSVLLPQSGALRGYDASHVQAVEITGVGEEYSPHQRKANPEQPLPLWDQASPSALDAAIVRILDLSGDDCHLPRAGSGVVDESARYPHPLFKSWVATSC